MKPRTAEEILDGLIGDVETISGFLSDFEDESKPLYCEAQAGLARAIRLTLIGAATEAVGQILLNERIQSGAKVQ